MPLARAVATTLPVSVGSIQPTNPRLAGPTHTIGRPALNIIGLRLKVKFHRPACPEKGIPSPAG